MAIHQTYSLPHGVTQCWRKLPEYCEEKIHMLSNIYYKGTSKIFPNFLHPYEFFSNVGFLLFSRLRSQRTFLNLIRLQFFFSAFSPMAKKYKISRTCNKELGVFEINLHILKKTEKRMNEKKKPFKNKLLEYKMKKPRHQILNFIYNI